MSTDTAETRLVEPWHRLLSDFGAAEAEADGHYADVVARYREPARHYHTLDHIEAVLSGVADLGGTGTVLLAAAWLHDVVYDPRAADNEERSAAFAAGLMARFGADPRAVEEVGRLILLTKAHRTEADDLAGRILIDADLAVLGAAPAEYDRYAAAIRREYAWVPEDRYRAGRADVLRRFLARERIYQTERMHAERESAARRNLRREIESLV